ncbi:MAG: dihydrodipicolinate synthase family protein [Thermodesulfobacteriota bacterium]
MLNGPKIHGIIGACLTPFHTNGTINYDALESEIEFIIRDADAISIGGANATEYTILSPEERRELMQRGTEMVGKRLPVIVGASSPSPTHVLKLAEYAASIGAEVIQVLMPLRPWGGQPTTGELINYFTKIASESPLPIAAYHNPSTGADPTIEALIRISEIDGVQYFKESSRDITKIGRLIEEIERSGKAYYFTTMQPLLMTLLMGGSGGMMPPPATRIGGEVVRAFRADDLKRAIQWQRLFSWFPGKWSSYGFPPLMKSAMKYFGIDLGKPVSPYIELSPKDYGEIGQFLREAGLIANGGSQHKG